MAKITPGPWRIGFSDGSGPEYIVSKAADPRGLPLAIIVSGGTDDWGITHGVKNPADALAISRVPEMLTLFEEIFNTGDLRAHLQRRVLKLLRELDPE